MDEIKPSERNEFLTKKIGGCWHTDVVKRWVYDNGSCGGGYYAYFCKKCKKEVSTTGEISGYRRKFRDWNAILPRNAGTRQRVRNPWVYLKLQFDNTTNLKLVLHDIVISYTV